MLNWVLFVLFVWGMADVLSGMRLLFWRVPVLLVGWAISPKRPPQIGYTREQLERMFQTRNPQARKDSDGQWVDEHGIPFLDAP